MRDVRALGGANPHGGCKPRRYYERIISYVREGNFRSGPQRAAGVLGLRLGGRHFGLDVVERRLKLDVFGRRVLLARAATSGPEFVHSSAEKHGADGGGGDDGEDDTDACRGGALARGVVGACLLYTSPSPRDQRGSRMPSSA